MNFLQFGQGLDSVFAGEPNVGNGQVEFFTVRPNERLLTIGGRPNGVVLILESLHQNLVHGGIVFHY